MLEQKFIERFWRGAPEFICQRRAITERAIISFHVAATRMLVVLLEIISIFDFSKLIRQSETPWPEPRCQSVRKPFAHKIDSGFALVSDVGANVQEMMGRDWFERSLAPVSSKIGASGSGAVLMHFSKRRLRDRRLPSRHSQETVSSESECAPCFRAT